MFMDGENTPSCLFSPPGLQVNPQRYIFGYVHIMKNCTFYRENEGLRSISDFE